MDNYNFDNTREEKKKNSSVIFDNERDVSTNKRSFNNTRESKQNKKSSKSETSNYFVERNTDLNRSDDRFGGTGGYSGGLRFVGIGLGIIAVIIITFIVISKLNDPVKKVAKYLNEQNYPSAVSLYNDRIFGKEKKENQINSLIEENINRCGDAYFDDIVDYDTAVQNLTVFEDIKKEEYASLAKSIISSISCYVDDKAIFDTGIDLMNSSNYLGAMEKFILLSNSSKLYSDAMDKYANCQEILLDEVADPETEEDYKAYIRILDGYLQVISSDSAFKERKNILEEEYAEMLDNALKAEILANAATAFESGEYSNAFELLNGGFKKFPSDQSIKSKITDYQKQYVEIIFAKANELSEKSKYSDALKLLDNANKVYECSEFKTLYEEIDGKRAVEMGKYDAPKIDFITYEGSIKSENQRDSYSLQASVSGEYGFQTDNMVSGFNITLRVFDSSGKEILAEYGMSKGSETSCWLTEGEYTVVIDERSGTGDYILYIGQAKEIVDVSSCDVVNDAIEFGSQVNRYIITAARQGTYHFGFTNIVSGFNLTCRVFDDLDYEIATEYGVSNGGGITATFEEGKTYKLYVYQRNGSGDYTMAIGKQTATCNLTVGQNVNHQITFVDQKNRYDMDLSANTNYKVNLSGMASGFKITVKVFDPLDYEISAQYGLSNNEFTFLTNSAGSYRITIYQRSGTGSYKLFVNKAE